MLQQQNIRMCLTLDDAKEIMNSLSDGIVKDRVKILVDITEHYLSIDADAYIKYLEAEDAVIDNIVDIYDEVYSLEEGMKHVQEAILKAKKLGHKFFDIRDTYEENNEGRA